MAQPLPDLGSGMLAVTLLVESGEGWSLHWDMLYVSL